MEHSHPSVLTFRPGAGAGWAQQRGKAALDSMWHGDARARKDTLQKSWHHSQGARSAEKQHWTRRPEDPSSSCGGGWATQGGKAARENTGVQAATQQKVSRSRDR